MRHLASVVAVVLSFGLVGPGVLAESISAEYLIWGALEKDRPAVTRAVITLIGSPRDGHQEWQMTCSLKAGDEFSIRAISERAPMTSSEGPGRFARYLFRDSRGKVTAYRRALTGEPLLPPFNFLTGFLPTCRAAMTARESFAIEGSYLGHSATLQATQKVADPPPWQVDFDLQLNPDMLVGMLWAAKDDGHGQDKDREYKYVELTEADHRELIEAGCNYLPAPKTREWVQDSSVFFRSEPEFPQDFYRSNYAGMEMLVDEPAVRLGLPDVIPRGITNPAQVADLLETRVRALYGRDGARSSLREAVRKKAAIGSLDLSVDDIPIWETLYEAAFYELEAGAGGFVHEGRYSMDTVGWQPKLLFRQTFPPTRQEALKCQYAVMRGAARAFNRSWGTSIYGQCEPEFREPALTLAYDMGARYFWFWTGDHDHHLPHREKLRLMRALSDYARAHPRPECRQLLRAAPTAIVLPWGYTFCFSHMFNLPMLYVDNLNSFGVPYRDRITAAMWEGILCAMRGEDFDFTIEHTGLDKLGYQRIFRVREDGSITESPTRPSTTVASLAMKLKLREKARAPAATTAPAASRPSSPTIIEAGNTTGPTSTVLQWTLHLESLPSGMSGARIQAKLRSLSPLPTASTSATIDAVKTSRRPQDLLIQVDGAAPGRYLLDLVITHGQTRTLEAEAQTLFIHPPRAEAH